VTRILVVEDEPAIATGLCDNLELEGYAVDVAADGAAALEIAQARAYDLILLDLMLPTVNGVVVCRELRQKGVRTPIIMLTARGAEADKIRGLEAGADDYVTKPFSTRELEARIKAVLRRSSPGSVYAFGCIKVDMIRCEVSRDGHSVDITAMEFKLLRVFLENAGQVLSLDRLIELAWGRNTILTDRVIYTHVNNLRGKIEDDPSNPRHLVSIRGLGYRFDL
jgi:DNA-binding response OmpR family regulator